MPPLLSFRLRDATAIAAAEAARHQRLPVMRTTQSEVTFRAPFTLNPMVGELPAGTYGIETDEEEISVGERTIYRRVATLLLLRGRGTTRTVKVDQKQLEAAIQADAGLTGRS
jgi:hypothetical protein